VTHITGNTYIDALIGLIPIAFVFFSMLKLRMPSYVASPVALAVSAALAAAVWKMPLGLIPGAIAEGVMLGLFPIVWVVFSAILAYNISLESGAMEKLKRLLMSISPDRRVLVLILAFAFGGFLEAAAGFGTAVAIPAGMMVAIGFEPVFATVVCLVANTIPVAFGVVGIPVITLAAVTGLPLHDLTVFTALQLLPFVILLPLLLLLLVAKSIRGLRGVVMLSIFAGLAFAAGQTLVAWMAGPELAAFAGSLLSLAVIVIWCRIWPVKPANNKESTALSLEKTDVSIEKNHTAGAFQACSPYILILALVLITRLIPGLAFLGKKPLTMEYMFYNGADAKPTQFALLTNPGTILFIAAIIGGFIQGLQLRTILLMIVKTFKQIAKTIITVLSIVSLAKVMGFSGMVNSIAGGIASLTGRYFPLFSPFIGAFGTFLTGSDTSSNVLFGELQRQTAVAIHSDPSWLAAANASGATAGKMISPQSIAIASSATGLKASEGQILSLTVRYSLVSVALLGLIVFVFGK